MKHWEKEISKFIENHTKETKVKPEYASYDLYENEDEYKIVLLAAGIEPDTIKISIDNNIMQISGDRPAKSETKYNILDSTIPAKIKSDLFMEFDLYSEQCKLDIDKITAKCKNGLLSIIIPKLKIPAKTIKIKID